MNENASLKGLKILVTRPADQADRLLHAIVRAGGQAASFPLIEIVPVNDPTRLAELKHLIQDLDQYQLLIFISSNAARYGLQWIDQYWPQFPVGLEVVAVGPATAAALSSLPCEVQTSAAGMLSEDLLQLPVLRAVAGKKVALFRGVGGRELLAETLRGRGAQVDYIETYQRIGVATPGTALLGLIRSAAINLLTVTSGQILDSLCQLVDIRETGIAQIPLLVPSERLREKALATGFKRVYSSAGATDEAIVAALAELAQTVRQLPLANGDSDNG